MSLNGPQAGVGMVYLVGAEDTSAQTSFVVDDFALNVQ